MGSTEIEHVVSATSVAGVHVHAKTLIVVASINFAYFAQLVAVVGSGLLAQSIGKLFNASTDTFWFSACINIFTVALGPPTSQIADLWGRKWPLVVCMMCGCIGAIVASRAESMGTVIAGFSVIGISFGGQPLLHAVVSEVLPRKQRPMAQASINITAGLGAIIGVCMGGSLLRYNELERYRIYLYVLAAIFAVATLGIALCYNPPARELQVSLTFNEKLRRLDWIGYSLFTPGLVLFCVALSWSKNPYPWSDARIIAPFVAGIVLVIAFAVYEWKFKKDGILHHGLFKSRNFGLALLTIFAEGLTFFAANSYFAFQVSVFTHSDLLISGLHFAITFLVSMVTAFVCGWISGKKKIIRIPAATGFLLILIFNICMATTTTSTPSSAFWGFPVLIGAGLGIILPTLMVAAQLSTPADLISTASALVISARGFGGTVGLAVNNAVFNGALSTNIPAKVAAATLPLGLPPSSIGMLIGALTASDQAALAQVPGVSPQIIGAAGAALTEAYGVGFRDAWIAACCFCVIAVIGSLFFFDPRSEFNAHIDAPAEEKLIEEQAILEGHRQEKSTHDDKKEEA